MLRIFVAENCSQILFLSSALRQAKSNNIHTKNLDILLLSWTDQDIPSSMKDTMLLMAKCVWPWLDIIWIDQYVRGEADSRRLEKGRNAISHLMGHYGRPEQLWCCMPNNVEAQTLMAMFPEAELHLFEDGLGTYIDLYTPLRLLKHPNRLRKRSWVLLQQKQKWLRRFFAQSANQYPIRPVARLHFFLASELNVPSHLKHVPISHIDVDHMLQTLRTVRKELSPYDCNLPDESPKKRVLITGQYYCQLVSGVWRQEFDMHARVIEFYQRHGYEVWWREHPKAQQPFGKAFAKNGIFVRTFGSNACLPIELFIAQDMFQQHVSVCSTTLYTLKKLYGIEPRTCIDLISFHIPGTFSYVKDLIKNSIQDYGID